MSTSDPAVVPSKIPFVETGTPPKPSMLAPSPSGDTPTRFAGDAERTKKESLETSSQSQVQARPGGLSSGEEATLPTSTSTETAKKRAPEQETKKTVSSEPHVSLPSTELKGAQPLEHTGGVGALPGNLSESSVALLPDEREERIEERQSTSLRQRRDTIKPSSTRNEENQELAKEKEKIPRGPALDSGASQPPDVAVTGVKTQNETGETAVGGTGTGGPGEKKDDVDESRLAAEAVPQSEGVKEGETASGRKVLPGYGGDYHPAQLHPPPPGASAAEFQSSSLGTQQERQTETSRRESASGEKLKPGFMTMVKGEMKILAGKMSGDEQKVEEGKRLVHGGA